MHWIDYAIMFVPFIIVTIVSWRTRRYVKSVADFMAGGRCAGRYLICNAVGEAGFGAVSAVAIFEYTYKTGFAISWWTQLSVPVTLIITLTGFVVYRYRETRAMTMAQFFEIRYSKGFRVFAGILAFTSGILNYGIFPAVGARFFVSYCGLPQTIGLGGITMPTFAILMAIFISLAMFLTLIGGQLTIMISDCLEGLLSGVLYLLVAATLLYIFRWSDIFAALAAAPKGESMLNPFDTGQAKDFDIWYVLIGLVGTTYSYMSWQGGHAFRSSAASPHEAKMGNILSVWREFSRRVMMTLLAVCAFTYLNHPKYAAGAAQVTAAIHKISEGQIQTQMRVPIALSYILPIGIRGTFACIMLFAMLACDGSYMHSWGSIFVQDMILPFRKKPLSPQQHIRILRWSIAGVGLFAFLFGLLFHQTEYILMFFAITGAVFLGGSGCAVLGGLYWKKGTTAAAWSGMLAGSILATGGIVLQQCWKWICPALAKAFQQGGFHNYLVRHADEFPVNGQVVWFIAICTAVILYIVVSLLTCQENFNMDRMLHRGPYATDTALEESPETVKRKFVWGRILGFDREFKFGDKMISGCVFVWSVFWFAVFVIGSLWYLWRPWPLEIWGHYWYLYGILLPFVIGVITTFWFTWGGVRDLRRLFVALRTVRRSDLDDGTVVGHRNLDEVAGNTKCHIDLPADGDRHSPDAAP